jgi:hypothetical protein
VAKRHWTNEAPTQSGLRFALCGFLSAEFAGSEERISCKLCKRELERLSAHPIAQAVEAAFVPFKVYPDRRFDSLPPSSSLPLIGPSFPFIKTGVLRALRCGCHSCETCRGFLDIERMPSDSPWREKNLPKSEYRWPGGLVQALEWFVDFAFEFPQKSIAAVIVELGILGAMVRSPNAGQETSATRYAEDRAVLSKSLKCAGDDINQAIVIASLVGRQITARNRISAKRKKIEAAEIAEKLSLTEIDVKLRARVGRELVSEYLIDKGYIPAERRRAHG